MFADHPIRSFDTGSVAGGLLKTNSGNWRIRRKARLDAAGLNATGTHPLPPPQPGCPAGDPGPRGGTDVMGPRVANAHKVQAASVLPTTFRSLELCLCVMFLI